MEHKIEVIDDQIEEKIPYVKPEITSCGNIFEITQGGGLSPGDTGFTLVDPGGPS